MSLVLVETLAEQPLTPEFLLEADERVLPCLEARNAAWCYSLLSIDRYRMICIFDAPDAESVRDAYRKAGATPQRIWTGTLIQPEAVPHAPALVIETVYSPLSEVDWNAARTQTLSNYAEQNMEWVRSYASLDRTRVMDELKMRDGDPPVPVQEIQSRLPIAVERVWSAEVVRPEVSVVR
jgi:hypothetical protein